METGRTVDWLFGALLSLALIGEAMFVTANTLGLSLALAAGATGVAVWAVAVCYLAYRHAILRDIDTPLAMFLFAAMIAVAWLGTMPPYFRDDLIVHLAVPKLIVQAGAWDIPDFQPAGNRPNLLLPLNLLFVAGGLDRIASLVPSLYTLGTATVLASWVRSATSPRWGFVAAIALATLPLFFRLYTTAYNDPAVMFFSCVAFHYLWRYLNENEVSLAVQAAVSFAAGTAVKYNAGLLLAIAIVFLLAIEAKEGRLRQWRTFVLSAVCAVAIFCGPWWLKNAINTSGAQSAIVSTSLQHGFHGALNERVFVCDESFPMAFTAPVRAFFDGREGRPCRFDGRLNPFILLFAFGILAVGARYRERFLLYAVLLYMVTAGLLINSVARYFLPVVPVLIFLSCLFLDALMKRRKKILAGGFASAMILFNLIETTNAAYRFEGWDYLRGNETKEQLLGRVVIPYNGFVFANHRLPPDARIYLAFLGNQAYHLDIPYRYDPFWSGKTLMNIVTQSDGPDAIQDGLKRLGVTHLMYQKTLMEKFLRQNGREDLFRRWQTNLSVPLYEDGLVELLALK